MRRLFITLIYTILGLVTSLNGLNITVHAQMPQAFLFQMNAEDFLIRGDYNQAIQLNPDYAEAYFLRGEKRSYEDKQRAIEDFSQAIRINPDYAAAYYNRGLIYFEQGNKEAAIQDFSQVLKINPEISEAYFMHALIRDSSGDRQGGLVSSNGTEMYAKPECLFYTSCSRDPQRGRFL
jgi:predicted TPR repeat methyltransferase